MEKKEQLKKELFAFDVTINGNYAKWQNNKHPDNPNFMQTVFWAAWESNGNLVVSYSLDAQKSKNYTHLRIPMDGKSFENAVFEHWSNQFA